MAKIGRTIAAGAIAGAIVLTPAVAFANYGAPSPSPSSSVLPSESTSPSPEPSQSTVAKTTSSETLSSTGFESVPMAVGAGILLVAGAATVVVAARRGSIGGQG